MREPCYKCKFEHNPIDREPCEYCSDEYMNSGDHPAFQWSKIPTNADSIRSMTDEEMAEWFSIYCCRNKTYDAHCDEFGNCKACWLDWLKEEESE